MTVVCIDEERRNSAVPKFEMSVCLKANGYRVRAPLSVLEFNRNGMALLSEQLLTHTQTLRVLVQSRTHTIGPIEATLHNCRPLKKGGYRCGIQFRLDSPEQLDGVEITRQLGELESLLNQSSTEHKNAPDNTLH